MHLKAVVINTFVSRNVSFFSQGSFTITESVILQMDKIYHFCTPAFNFVKSNTNHTFSNEFEQAPKTTYIIPVPFLIRYGNSFCFSVLLYLHRIT